MENTVENLVETKMQLEKTIDSLIRAFAHENNLPLDKISGQNPWTREFHGNNL